MRIHAITCDLGLDCTCNPRKGFAMARKGTPPIKLTARDLEILGEALDHYRESPDRDDPVKTIDRIIARVDRLRPGITMFYLPATHAAICSSALDSYLYWEVSEEQDRNDGFVFYENDPDVPNGKMDRDDRDPAYVAACREVDTLARRFEELSRE